MIDYVPDNCKGVSMGVKSKNTLLLEYNIHWCILMCFRDARHNIYIIKLRCSWVIPI